MYGYFHPDDPFRRGNPKEVAREHFWRTIREVAPEVFQKLREEVLPVARAFFAGSRGGAKPDRMPLVEALRAWAREVNLCEQKTATDSGESSCSPTSPGGPLNQGETRFETWVLARAFNQITRWFFDEENPGSITAELTMSTSAQEKIKYLHKRNKKEHSLSVILPSPGVSSDKWEEFEKDVLKKLRERRKHLVRKGGWQKVSRKRNPGHFEWLVRYQVQGWRPLRIAREYLPQNEDCSDLTNTVRDALKATADLCDLTLRKHRPGRPSK